MLRRDFMKLMAGMTLGLVTPDAITRVSQLDDGVVEKFRLINRYHAQIIKRRSAQTIVEESTRLAPLLSDILRSVKNILSPSISEMDIHDYILEKLIQSGMSPAMAGYESFPAAAAISTNEELIHSIPRDINIPNNSLVTIETGGASDKAYASQGWTFSIGDISQDSKIVLDATKRALRNAIDSIHAGVTTGDIGAVVQKILRESGCHPIREYCGFTMGVERIQEPLICSYGKQKAGSVLKINQILNINILAKRGSWPIKIGSDGWTVYSRDGRPSAAVTAMVLVEKDDCKLLSKLID